MKNKKIPVFQFAWDIDNGGQWGLKFSSEIEFYTAPVFAIPVAPINKGELIEPESGEWCFPSIAGPKADEYLETLKKDPNNGTFYVEPVCSSQRITLKAYNPFNVDVAEYIGAYKNKLHGYTHFRVIIPNTYMDDLYTKHGFCLIGLGKEFGQHLFEEVAA